MTGRTHRSTPAASSSVACVRPAAMPVLRHALSAALLAAVLLSPALAAADKVSGKRDGSAATPAAATQAPAAQVFDLDVAADPAAAWNVFLSKADFAPTHAAYDVLADISYNAEGVDAAACAEHRQALLAAVRAVPLSIALRRAEMLCAEAEGDEARAERALKALAALSRSALKEHGDGAMRRPIRVVEPWDVYALLHTLGYEFRYEYRVDVRVMRYHPLTVAAWDPQREIERHLSFDYIDTSARIDREDPNAGWPILRDINTLAYARGQAQHEDAVGLDVLAISESLEADTQEQRVALLRKAAERGGLHSMALWLAACDSPDAAKNCSDGLIDALLPLAEQRHALPMALLSHAYRYGIGIPRDTTAADRLLEAAETRWHRKGASANLAWLMLKSGLSERAQAYVPQLRASADAGNPDARYLLLLFRVENKGARLTDAEIAFLRDPANNGLGNGDALLNLYYLQTDDEARALEARERAAAAGNPAAQYLSGLASWTGKDGKPIDRAEAERLLRLSAEGGDVDAMRAMSYVEVERGAWANARRWLLPAVDRGDAESALALADLYADERPGVEGTPEDAARLYALLDTHYDMADARRRLAKLAMWGRGMRADPAKARRLLERDAETGDSQSQALLGMALLLGELGRPDQKNGMRWMDRAIAAGDVDAMVSLGSWLVARETPTERGRGLSLLEDAFRLDADGAHRSSARNNLAWERCVSRHADVRDAAKGLIVARPMEDDPDTDAAAWDTVAACYAANGDFAKAAKLQQKAIDMFADRSPDAVDPDSGIAKRLALYRAGRAYIAEE